MGEANFYYFTCLKKKDHVSDKDARYHSTGFSGERNS